MANCNSRRGGWGRVILIAVVGGVGGLLLAAPVGAFHLNRFWRGGGEAAGTEVILVPLYALAGGMLGTVAGLVGGLWLRGRRPRKVVILPPQSEPR